MMRTTDGRTLLSGEIEEDFKGRRDWTVIRTEAVTHYDQETRIATIVNGESYRVMSPRLRLYNHGEVEGS